MSEAVRELRRIPLSSIRENPVALRSVKRQDPQYIGLLDSIKTVGVLNPILVRPIPGENGESLFSVIEGLHRYTGSLDAGLTDIPAQIISMDEASVMEAQLIGNAHRIETKPVEYSKHLQRILASNPLLTMAQLASKLSKTTTWLSERLGLVKLTENVAKLVDEGKINLSNAYALAKLPDDEQVSFVDRAMSMTPQEFTPTVLARKKELDSAKRQGRDPNAAEFIPVPHLQKLSDLKNEMERPSVGPVLVRENNLTTAAEGFALGIRWALHMDSRSIETAKEQDAERKKALEDKKQLAAQDRARKKAADAAETAAKLQTQGA